MGILTASKYTTTVPLTVNQIKTYGTAAGNVKVSIYTDSSGSPGTRLFTEVARYGNSQYMVNYNNSKYVLGCWNILDSSEY